MTYTVLLKHGKNDGIAVYVAKETVLKEMAAKIDLVWELSNNPHRRQDKNLVFGQ
jgi:hypothetical protein